MNNEEKYKEAIERAKNIYCASECKDILCTLETIFPELLEIKDEKIRKDIIAFIKENYPSAKSWIAWLEKQRPSDAALEYLKENHSPSEVSDFQAALNISVALAYDKGMADATAKMQEEQEVTWTEDDEMVINAITQLMKDDERINKWESTYVDGGNTEVKFEHIASWLQSLKSRMQPQNCWKPSKEQMVALRWILLNIPYNTHKEKINELLEQLQQL